MAKKWLELVVKRPFRQFANLMHHPLLLFITYIKLNISGTSVDWEVSLQVGSAGPSHAIPPGWYVEDPRDGLLLGNLPINGDIYVPKC